MKWLTLIFFIALIGCKRSDESSLIDLTPTFQDAVKTADRIEIIYQKFDQERDKQMKETQVLSDSEEIATFISFFKFEPFEDGAAFTSSGNGNPEITIHSGQNILTDITIYQCRSISWDKADTDLTLQPDESQKLKDFLSSRDILTD